MSEYVQGFKQKYKTEMCKNFMVTGKCEFMNSCSFAHGQDELQSKQHVHTNYKTKKCKRYHQELCCPYGKRCQFLHAEYVQANTIDLTKTPNFYQEKLDVAKQKVKAENTELSEAVIFD